MFQANKTFHPNPNLSFIFQRGLFYLTIQYNTHLQTSPQRHLTQRVSKTPLHDDLKDFKLAKRSSGLSFSVQGGIPYLAGARCIVGFGALLPCVILLKVVIQRFLTMNHTLNLLIIITIIIIFIYIFFFNFYYCCCCCYCYYKSLLG